MSASSKNYKIGDKFGRLTILGEGRGARSSGRKIITLICKCECGAIKGVEKPRVLNGITVSCGCLQREVTTKHGESAWKSRGTKEWRAWAGMIARCGDPNNKKYRNHGGRGIRVCEQWKADYKVFLKDVGRAPSPDHSIDRIDNNGNYEPGNVWWATRAYQQMNRRNSKNLHINISSGFLSFGC